MTDYQTPLAERTLISTKEYEHLYAEIAKLQRWVKLAVDAYNSADEDACCVACMTISDEQLTPQAFIDAKKERDDGWPDND